MYNSTQSRIVMHSISPAPSFHSYGITSRFIPPKSRYIGHQSGLKARKLSRKEIIEKKKVARTRSRLGKCMPNLLNAFIIYHESTIVLVKREIEKREKALEKKENCATKEEKAECESDSSESKESVPPSDTFGDFWSFLRAKSEDIEPIFESFKFDLDTQLGLVEACIVFFFFCVYPCTYF